LAVVELCDGLGDVSGEVDAVEVEAVEVAVEPAADGEGAAEAVAAGLPEVALPPADAEERAVEGLELPPGEQAATRTSTAQMLARRADPPVMWPERNSMAACYRVPSNGSVGGFRPGLAAATLRAMDAWELSAVEEAQAASGRRYHEFLRVPDLSAGLYVLEAGEPDRQSPHSEDELYFVVTGRGRVTVGEDDRAVEAGTLVFVAANVAHRFHDVTERLELLVVFGPAEGDRA
jgi:mannose-6-phosphate isomerase-like protein (cupin superfamily)